MNNKQEKNIISVKTLYYRIELTETSTYNKLFFREKMYFSFLFS
jgi:hypothetical protein